jgi:hypothetical protein
LVEVKVHCKIFVLSTIALLIVHEHEFVMSLWHSKCSLWMSYIKLNNHQSNILLGGLMPYIRYMCLFAYNGFQHILCYVFALFVSVMCTLCYQFLWIVHFWLLLQYSLMFIFVMCTLWYQFLWIVHFWLPLQYSLMFIYSIIHVCRCLHRELN